MPFNFYIIIAVQFFVFITFYIYGKRLEAKLWKVILLGSIFGVVLGSSFDIILGYAGIFTYMNPSLGVGVYPWNLTTTQLIANGLLSYGLSVITAYFIVGNTERFIHLNKNLITTACFVIIVISIMLSVLITNSLILMLTYGTLILATGELVLVLTSRCGPIISLMTRRGTKIFFHYWFLIILIGLSYEAINATYPFWIWLPGLDYSHFLIELLIIVFGYPVLFHPMLVFWQLVGKKF